MYKMYFATNPSFIYGVDIQESRGSLVLFCWGPFDVDVICSTSHLIFCKISTRNGITRHMLFSYGESQHQYRLSLWSELHNLLQHYQKFLIIGDINQVEKFSNKLGGFNLIRDWEDIVN